MSKQITSLVADIYQLLEQKQKIDPSLIDEFTTKLNTNLKGRFNGEAREPSLSMSSFGQPDRKLWYKINTPEKGEPLRGEVLLKFMYGDIIELLVLMLAKASGHEVKGEQDEVRTAGVVGHRDAIVDGVLVDVKSASSFAFDKFKYHKLEADDPFGYLDQLALYITASQDDLAIKKSGAFIAVNKENGQLAVDVYNVKRSSDYDKEAIRKRGMLAEANPPARCYPDEEDGKSGNRKLGVNCSYCEFREHCWGNLRTFLYSGKPRYLTHVAREPDVLEFKKKKEQSSATMKDKKNGETTPSSIKSNSPLQGRKEYSF